MVECNDKLSFVLGPPQEVWDTPLFRGKEKKQSLHFAWQLFVLYPGKQDMAAIH